MEEEKILSLYFNDATKNQFAKLHCLITAMEKVLDEQYIYMIKKNKNDEGLKYIRSAITFTILGESMMTENPAFPLYRQMELEKAKAKYIEETSSNDIEKIRYPYTVNLIGKNAILNEKEQTLGVCLTYHTWYIEQKLKELELHFKKSKELIDFKIILKSIVRSMKMYFKTWTENIESFKLDVDTFEIKEDMDIFDGEELERFKSIKKSGDRKSVV